MVARIGSSQNRSKLEFKRSLCGEWTCLQTLKSAYTASCVIERRITFLMDHQRSSTLRHSQQLTTAKHICSLCGKPRSKRYHDQHPLRTGQVPEPGICSRSKCATAVDKMMRPACQVIICETHYHYHSTSGLEESPPSYTAEELQLPDNTVPSLRRSSWVSSPVQEGSSPLNLTSGSEETPVNYTAAELPGESSLKGRVELPDNMCSRRRTFRGLSPIPEESPPPVNFLRKPTLQTNNKGIGEK